jgi:hypothetical protein
MPAVNTDSSNSPNRLFPFSSLPLFEACLCFFFLFVSSYPHNKCRRDIRLQRRHLAETAGISRGGARIFCGGRCQKNRVIFVSQILIRHVNWVSRWRGGGGGVLLKAGYSVGRNLAQKQRTVWPALFFTKRASNNSSHRHLTVAFRSDVSTQLGLIPCTHCEVLCFYLNNSLFQLDEANIHIKLIKHINALTVCIVLFQCPSDSLLLAVSLHNVTSVIC